MIGELLSASQWCHKHRFAFGERLFDKLKMLICGADIPGRAKIHPTVSFAHGGLGVIVNAEAEIGERCIINTKVTLGMPIPTAEPPSSAKAST